MSSRSHNLSASQRRSKKRTLLRRDGNRCHWCKVEFCDVVPPTIDHLVSRKLGGTNALSNLVLACSQCNHARHLPNSPEVRPHLV